MNHSEYIQSDEWKRLRQEALSLYGDECMACEECFNVQLHHVYYPPNIRCTKVEHLMPLCDTCHRTIHKSKNFRAVTYNESHIERKKEEIVTHLARIQRETSSVIQERRQKHDADLVKRYKIKREHVKQQIANRSYEERRARKKERSFTPPTMIASVPDSFQLRRWIGIR